MQLTLKAARKRSKLALKVIAEKAGVNKSTILRIQRGDVKPLHDTIVSLEQAMGLDPGTLKVRKAS